MDKRIKKRFSNVFNFILRRKSKPPVRIPTRVPPKSKVNFGANTSSTLFAQAEQCELKTKKSRAYELTPSHKFVIKKKLKTTIVDSIGSGSFGVVYSGVERAKKGKTERKVAIKIASSKYMEIASMEQWKLRAKCEIRILKKLNHPNIMNYYGHVWMTDPLISEIPCYVAIKCELLDLPLGKYLENGPIHKLEIIIWLIRQVCSAFEYLFEHKIAHHDLKPDNIVMQMIAPTSNVPKTVKIIDFGFARAYSTVGRHTKESEHRSGTKDFCSPEKLDYLHSYNPYRADSYALGAVIMECLFGLEKTRDALRLAPNKSMVDLMDELRPLYIEQFHSKLFILIQQLMAPEPARLFIHEAARIL